VHHGEIGTVLALSSLLLRATSVPTAAVAIVAGIGMGLIKDDHADIGEWFRFKKKNFHKQKYTKIKVTSLKQQKDITVTKGKQHEYNSKSERRSDIFNTLLYPDQGDKKIVGKLIFEPLQKQIRNLIDTQSQTMEQIESQIKKIPKPVAVEKRVGNNHAIQNEKTMLHSMHMEFNVTEVRHTASAHIYAYFSFPC